ncbi:multidrug transporter [Lactiplantibacillus fabifermentans T30PCM01]|uniref:Multidrug transporter n=1 Tax=Lactiplantibacillus fabifermentans T30PCM01 TaxID=1400520 RepID=W6TBF3_9LACO|nr:DHA2 family efflux MFS transporter permease subunit [Lactiplantibacillus fabifermentans]ETY72540.1 multidrug transporter [Lactiplantibacillus fabifermentans T30PCM01]
MLTINSSVKKRNAMLGVLLIGAFTMLLTETFFNNALPTIIKTYQVSQSTAQWVSTGYQLVAGLMIPLSAWVFHRFNTKKTFITLTIIFLIGCILGFFAHSFGWLLAGRLIQAIAAGSMIPLIQNVVLVLYPESKRGTVMGIIGLVVAFGPALGPTIGGWVIDNLGLIWLSGVLIPLVLILLIAAIAYVRPVVAPDNSQIDWISVAESSLGFAAILYGFSAIGNAGKLDLVSTLCLIAGVIILVLFAKRQLKLTNPLINLTVFKNMTFSLTTVLSALSNIALLGVELVLPMYLQRVHGLSALMSGLLLLPGALLEGLISPISGKLYDRFGIKPISLIGFAIIALGTLPMLFFTPKTSLIIVAGTYAFRIIGVATVMMPTFTEGLNALPANLSVHGNAASSTVRQIAGSLGTAILMMVVAFGTQQASTEHLSAINQLNHGYWFSFLIAFLMALLGFLLSFKLKDNGHKN